MPSGMKETPVAFEAVGNQVAHGEQAGRPSESFSDPPGGGSVRDRLRPKRLHVFQSTRRARRW
jgi:hypothetical protein